MGGAGLGSGSAEARPALPTGELIGRDREVSQGMALVDGAASGHGALLLVSGEPGIGKSRFADELARRAVSQGFQVVWGRCWEAGGAPPYWPWVQSLRALARGLTAQEIRDRGGLGVAEAAQPTPDTDSIAGGAQQSSVDADAARFRLFDATATFLRNAAASCPLLVVLDDLQVADVPSLLLLQFVVDGLGSDRLLIIATYRDNELDAVHPLTATLTQLVRREAVHRVALRGLAEADVGPFIEAISGVAPHESVVRAVHDETDGNPLFLKEVTQLLVEDGQLQTRRVALGSRVALPPSLRDVIGLRLVPLGKECIRVLRLASVLGREFSVAALCGLTGLTPDVVLDSIDAAFRAGVIGDVPGTKDSLRFSHVLVRETLYDGIARSERMRLHRLAGRVLESLYGEDLTANLGEVAHQYFEGADERHAEEAVTYARRAGDRAVASLAFEEAVRLYSMALTSLQLSRSGDLSFRCEVTLQLGEAQALSGDHFASKNTFLQAADLARALGAKEMLARAALGYGGRFVLSRAGGDPHIVPMLRESLAAIGEHDSELRARLLARLAGALRDEPVIDTRAALSRDAVSLARRLGDPATLAYTLEGMFWALWTPGNARERLAIADEVIEIGEGAGDMELVLHGRENRRIALFELADVAAMSHEVAKVARLAGQLRQPTQTWLPASSRSLQALFEGRFAEAEPLIIAARNTREQANPSDAEEAYVLQMFMLRREQARLAEIEELVRGAARDITWYPVLRCALALLYCEIGKVNDARAEFERLAAADFAAVPFDNNWLFSMSLLSEAAYQLGDEQWARHMHALLLPFSDRNAAVEVSTGSLSRSLGLLATVFAAFDDAAEHYERAIEHNEQMGARPWVARAQHDLAVMLLERCGDGDVQYATTLLHAALRASEAMDMVALRVDVARALSRLGVAAGESEATLPSVITTTDEASAASLLRLEGEYWTMVYEGRTLRLRDTKGMRILVRLLGEPNRPHPSLDLERHGASGDEAVARAVAAGDAGEHLDEQARSAYRVRIVELRGEIEEAEAWGKSDQAGALREELEFITRELGRGLGLGGRTRRAGSVSERARLNVTRALKSAIQRIAEVDAGLGAHLASTIRTGTVCVYAPDARSPIEWRREA